MPHWNDKGEEEWVCQKGAHVCTGTSTWVVGLGNVCPTCMSKTFFRELAEGDTFRFASETDPRCIGFQRGLCRKDSERTYTYVEDGMKCTVGTIHVEVTPTEE